MVVSLPSARHRGCVCAIPGVVDVWRADLDAAPEWLEDLLCASERARAAQIVHERNRVRWARSRGMLRELLGRYLDTDPRGLWLDLGTQGKPRLLSEPQGTPLDSDSGSREDLRFNLSHSGELMLVAVTAGREVGVDVERAHKRYTAEFMRAWTVREATVKCLGTGLGATLVATESAPEGMWTAVLDVGPRAFATVAVASVHECELCLRDWPG